MRAAPGTLVLVVGPSGAGKDTLIGYARTRLAGRDDVVFARRVVTRTADTALEDHDTLCEADFEAQADVGGFALHWRAHGLRYGLPCDIDAALGAGHTVVANISRAAVAAARARYGRVVVALVTASVPVRAARLAARGRETAAAVEARLARAADAAPADAIEIVNDGSVAEAGDAFLALVERTLVT